MSTGKWPKEIRVFETIKDELRTRNGILTRMGATIVPSALRHKTLRTAHRGHPGERAMKSILKGKVWWPAMLAQAERWVKTCEPCTLMGKRNPPMPMQRSELPEAPWEELALDFNGPYQIYNGVMILHIVDSYSRFLIALPVKGTSFETTQAALEGIFETYGYPKAIKSDGGPPFNGHQWRKYLESRDVVMRLSTPQDAQSNGGIETYMRIVNKGMTAPSIEGGKWSQSLADAIAAHNAAVCTPINERPEVIMFGRRLKRNLPATSSFAGQPNDHEIRSRDLEGKMKAKMRDDVKRGAKYSSISVGDKVHIARSSKAKGETTFHPMKYTVVSKKHGALELLSPSGGIVKRTVTFVKKSTAQEHDKESLGCDAEDQALTELEEPEKEMDNEPAKIPKKIRKRERKAALENWLL